MRHTVYFLVEANESAHSKFPTLAGDNAILLLDSLLMSRQYFDRSTWREDEAELAVKLIYLARIREYTPFESDAEALRVLGSNQISVDLFDHWWSIRRLRYEEGPSEEMEDYLRQVINKVGSTGNTIVDDWLKGLSDGAT